MARARRSCRLLSYPGKSLSSISLPALVPVTLARCSRRSALSCADRSTSRGVRGVAALAVGAARRGGQMARSLPPAWKRPSVRPGSLPTVRQHTPSEPACSVGAGPRQGIGCQQLQGSSLLSCPRGRLLHCKRTSAAPCASRSSTPSGSFRCPRLMRRRAGGAGRASRSPSARRSAGPQPAADPDVAAQLISHHASWLATDVRHSKEWRECDGSRLTLTPMESQADALVHSLIAATVGCGAL